MPTLVEAKVGDRVVLIALSDLEAYEIDILCFGRGFLRINGDGVATHVPLSEVNPKVWPRTVMAENINGVVDFAWNEIPI